MPVLCFSVTLPATGNQDLICPAEGRRFERRTALRQRRAGIQQHSRTDEASLFVAVIRRRVVQDGVPSVAWNVGGDAVVHNKLKAVGLWGSSTYSLRGYE